MLFVLLDCFVLPAGIYCLSCWIFLFYLLDYVVGPAGLCCLSSPLCPSAMPSGCPYWPSLHIMLDGLAVHESMAVPHESLVVPFILNESAKDT